MSPDATRPGRGGPGRKEDIAGAECSSVWSHSTRTPRQLDRLERYLTTARLTDLGQFLNEIGTVHEDHGFHCTRCQRTPAQQITHAPAAYATSPLAWKCTACGKVGNRWTVVGAIRARQTVLARVLAHLEDEEDRRG